MHTMYSYGAIREIPLTVRSSVVQEDLGSILEAAGRSPCSSSSSMYCSGICRVAILATITAAALVLTGRLCPSGPTGMSHSFETSLAHSNTAYKKGKYPLSQSALIHPHIQQTTPRRRAEGRHAVKAYAGSERIFSGEIKGQELRRGMLRSKRRGWTHPEIATVALKGLG